MMLFGGTAAGQESLRMSLAGAEAARARREAASRPDAYNLQLGPTAWAFGVGLGIEYSDNLRGTAADPQEDVSFRPQLDAQMRWALSDVNTLNLSLGAGYAAYASYSEYNRPFITPGSELSFDFYAGDFWINVHDRFSIQENGYLDPTVTGIGDYERLENVAGISGTWDLNKIIVRMGYDHVNYVSLGEQNGQPDAELEVFSSSAAWTVRPGMLTGVEVGGSLVRYGGLEEDVYAQLYYSDGTQWSAGAFLETQVSQYISGRASAGYTVFTPESDLEERLGDDFSGVYAQLSATHRVNRHLDYTLSGGRLLNFAYYGGKVDQYFVTVNARWHVLRKTAIGTLFSYQHGLQVGVIGEKYDWFGPALTLDRKITAKLTASLAYRFYWRGSNLPYRDYTANVISLRGIYRF